MEQCAVVSKRYKYNNNDETNLTNTTKTTWESLLDDLLIASIDFIQYANTAFIHPMQVNRHWANVLRLEKFWNHTAVHWPCVEKKNNRNNSIIIMPSYLLYSKGWQMYCNRGNGHSQCQVHSLVPLAQVKKLELFHCKASMMCDYWMYLNNHSTLRVLRVHFPAKYQVPLISRITLPKLEEFVCTSTLSPTAEHLVSTLLSGMPAIKSLQLELPLYLEGVTTFYNVLSSCATLKWLKCILPPQLILPQDTMHRLLLSSIELFRFEIQSGPVVAPGGRFPPTNINELIVGWLPHLRFLDMQVLSEKVFNQLCTSLSSKSFNNLTHLKCAVHLLDSSELLQWSKLATCSSLPNLRRLKLNINSWTARWVVQFLSVMVHWCVTIEHLGIVFHPQLFVYHYEIIAALPTLLHFKQLQRIGLRFNRSSENEHNDEMVQQSNTELILRMLIVFMKLQSSVFEQFQFIFPETYYYKHIVQQSAAQLKLPVSL